MYLLAFTLGLVGSLHCVGMCGPIALLIPLQRQHKGFRYLQLGAYFTGKTLAYSLIGLLFGLVGEGLFIAEYQQEFSILAGLVMVSMGLFSLFHISLKGVQNPLLKGFALLKNALGRQLTKKTLSSSFTIGFLNGFLPCGLVYTADAPACTFGRFPTCGLAPPAEPVATYSGYYRWDSLYPTWSGAGDCLPLPC